MSSSLFRKACDGNIAAIKRLGTSARLSLATADLKLVIAVLLHRVSNEIQSTRRSSSEKYHSRPATLEAMNAVHGVLISRSLWTGPAGSRLCSAFSECFDESSTAWSDFWAWASFVAEQSILDPASYRQEINVIDAICPVLVTRTAVFRQRIGSSPDILRAFTGLWLTDSDYPGRFTATLPHLINSKVFGKEQFFSALGCSAEEAVKLCLEYLRTVLQYMRDTDKMMPDELENNATLLRIFMEDGLRLLIANNSVPLYIELAEVFLKHAVADLRLLGHLRIPQTAFMVTATLTTIHAAFSLGMVYYILQAIDAGLLSVIITTSIFWRHRASVHDHETMARLGQAVDSILMIIQRHTYESRVLRHFMRSSKVLGISPLYSDVCPFKARWKFLQGQADYLQRIRGDYRLVRTANPCSNHECPHRCDRRRKIFECCRCFVQRVCSEACQRALWSRHRSQCDTHVKNNGGTIFPMKSFVKIADEREWFGYVIRYIASDRFMPQLRSLYEKHQVDMRLSSSLQHPTLMFAIDFDPEPSKLRVERISVGLARGSGVRAQLELLKFTKNTESVIIHANFMLGDGDPFEFATYIDPMWPFEKQKGMVY